MGNRMKAFDEAAFGKLLQHLYDTESSAKINVDQSINLAYVSSDE